MYLFLMYASFAAGLFSPTVTGTPFEPAQGETYRVALAQADATPDDGILELGDTGQEVATLQRALGLTPDGRFGTETEDALKRFQRAHNLNPDGRAGPATQSQIQSSASTVGLAASIAIAAIASASASDDITDLAQADATEATDSPRLEAVHQPSVTGSAAGGGNWGGPFIEVSALGMVVREMAERQAAGGDLAFLHQKLLKSLDEAGVEYSDHPSGCNQFPMAGEPGTSGGAPYTLCIQKQFKQVVTVTHSSGFAGVVFYDAGPPFSEHLRPVRQIVRKIDGTTSTIDYIDPTKSVDNITKRKLPISIYYERLETASRMANSRPIPFPNPNDYDWDGAARPFHSSVEAMTDFCGLPIPPLESGAAKLGGLYAVIDAAAKGLSVPGSLVSSACNALAYAVSSSPTSPQPATGAHCQNLNPSGVPRTYGERHAYRYC